MVKEEEKTQKRKFFANKRQKIKNESNKRLKGC